ncbi:MAG: DUF5916 domain-containing protein [Lentimicrobiaceae bacterium]|jgi:hypothetical protein
MNTKRLLIFSGLFICFIANSHAQSRAYHTNRLTGKAPLIDGKYDETSWNAVDWAGDFIQHYPNDGAKPSQNSRFKILYDDDNLYIIIQALDSVPGEIVNRLSRRDKDDGDWLAISIDSYADKQTAFTFGITSAGVQFDFMFVNDNISDNNWDAVYYTATSIDAMGWTAEMRIPLSQLRFAKMDKHAWGINIFRYIYRKQELSFWQHIPRTAPGFVSLYGQLQGLDGIRPRRDVELVPYANAKATYDKKEAGNPYKTGQKYSGTAGLDGKIAVTNDLTLNFTINPDFGQVEADPAVVNLTAFETFFPEKRPFFVEGKNIFNFKLTGADSENNMNMLFYSRRIGRAPHLVLNPDSGIYVSAPEQTTILGSFKLSGKTRKGLSIGIIESVTRNEKATIDSAGVLYKEGIEPLTNYLIARVSQDFNKGTTTIGGIFTATNRSIKEPQLEFLPNAAYSGGLDAIHFWKNKTYYLSGRAVFSSIYGSKQAITNLQLSAVRYYQRPDNTYTIYDPNRTGLSGYGGTAEFGKAGTGNWQYLTYLTLRSPGLDFNDAGYLKQADEIQHLFWLRYRKYKPFGIFRWASANFTEYRTWDFGGENTNKGIDFNTNGQFKNYYTAGAGINYAGSILSRGELWGGPALLLPPVFNFSAFTETDSRKKIMFRLSTSHYFGQQGYYNYHKYGLEITYKPVNTLFFSLIPQFSSGFNQMQYVDVTYLNDEPRYIMASLSRKIFDLSMRINVSITPRLSIQYYAQPYIFAGKYSDYKEITDPRADAFSNRYHQFSINEISYNKNWKAYMIDENHDGEDEYGFYKPDFHFLQYKSNMVFRWEYKTGSSLYLVWSQGRTNLGENGENIFGQYVNDLWNTQPRNDFMLKISYLIVF